MTKFDCRQKYSFFFVLIRNSFVLRLGPDFRNFHSAIFKILVLTFCFIAYAIFMRHFPAMIAVSLAKCFASFVLKIQYCKTKKHYNKPHKHI